MDLQRVTCLHSHLFMSNCEMKFNPKLGKAQFEACRFRFDLFDGFFLTHLYPPGASFLAPLYVLETSDENAVRVRARSHTVVMQMSAPKHECITR